jgi:rsbT antagonist protein RsbS
VDTPIPILKLGRSLLVPLSSDLSDEAALNLQERLLYRLQETTARGVVIDISVLDVVDSFLGRVFSDLSRMVALMDGVTVLVGMRPQVAMTLVELGLELRGLLAALDLEQGLDLVERRLVERDATAWAPEPMSDGVGGGPTIADIASLAGMADGRVSGGADEPWRTTLPRRSRSSGHGG